MGPIKRVVVVGLDGLDRGLVEGLFAAGELPNLKRLQSAGGLSPVRTTYPAQTPVAWSTFATGVNPGRHGVYDFIRRDVGTYVPQLGLCRYEQKNPFVPPRARSLCRATPLWKTLGDAGVESTVLRCPCTFTPEGGPHQRLLAGMGVPDLRGGLGTSTYYTTGTAAAAGENESVVHVEPTSRGWCPGSTIQTVLYGPLDPKTRQPQTIPLAIEFAADGDRVLVRPQQAPDAVAVRAGQWSQWLTVRFRRGLFQHVHGMFRFHLVSVAPELRLYASPINFDPHLPVFPVSDPPEYAGELADALGPYHTLGMAEDHGGLANGRFDEYAFLAQCDDVYREREAMLFYELNRLDEGLLFCLFDTPDRIQHMFWRHREPDHAANRCRQGTGDFRRTIEEHYRRCDATVGRVLDASDDRTLLVVLSDHGFGSFRRGMNINAWLHQQGLLCLDGDASPGPETDCFFHNVDWSRTKAYALGLGGIYVNQAGREQQGIVSADVAPALKRQIAEKLTGLEDAHRAQVAVRSVSCREEVYEGEYAEEAPDLLVNFNRGYRASWGTALGGVQAEVFEDNTRAWAGDHIVDPVLVPGVLLLNRAFHAKQPSLIDLAPTILRALDVPIPSVLEGESLIA